MSYHLGHDGDILEEEASDGVYVDISGHDKDRTLKRDARGTRSTARSKL